MKSIVLSAGLRIDQSVGKDAARKTYDCNNTDQGLANFFYKVHVFGFVDHIVIFLQLLNSSLGMQKEPQTNGCDRVLIKLCLQTQVVGWVGPIDSSLLASAVAN